MQDYQGGAAPSHASIYRVGFGDIGAGRSGTGAEFDVPKCTSTAQPGCGKDARLAPDGSWVYKTSGIWTGSGGDKLAGAACFN